MDLFQLISILCPAAIPTLLESKKDEKNIFLKYLIYVMFINLLNVGIVYYVFKHQALVFTPSFTIKYLAIGIVNGLFCYLFASIAKKYCSIELNISKKEKKSSKDEK